MRRSTRFATAGRDHYRPEGSIGDTGERRRLVNVTLVSEGFFDLSAFPYGHGRAHGEEDLKANAVRGRAFDQGVAQRVLDPGVVVRCGFVNAQPVVVVGVAPGFDVARHRPVARDALGRERGYPLEAYVRFAPGRRPRRWP